MTEQHGAIFTDEVLGELFPAERSNAFFEALFGDASEGAYDITLHFNDSNGDQLQFSLHLNQRPGQCLACNLTYGLPEVFSRHPIINLAGVAAEVSRRLGKNPEAVSWSLGSTQSHSSALHTIPFQITVAD